MRECFREDMSGEAIIYGKKMSRYRQRATDLYHRRGDRSRAAAIPTK